MCHTPSRERSKLNRHSAHPDHCSGELDEAEEMDGASVVARGEASEMLEFVEAALDTVPASVDERVMRDRF